MYQVQANINNGWRVMFESNSFHECKMYALANFPATCIVIKETGKLVMSKRRLHRVGLSFNEKLLSAL